MGKIWLGYFWHLNQHRIITIRVPITQVYFIRSSLWLMFATETVAALTILRKFRKFLVDAWNVCIIPGSNIIAMIYFIFLKAILNGLLICYQRTSWPLVGSLIKCLNQWGHFWNMLIVPWTRDWQIQSPFQGKGVVFSNLLLLWSTLW